MPLSHKISEVLSMRIDKTDKNVPVVEMEFKFVRYRLIVDSFANAKKLLNLLNLIMNRELDKKKVKMDLPKFYRKTK